MDTLVTATKFSLHVQDVLIEASLLLPSLVITNCLAYNNKEQNVAHISVGQR